MRFRITRHAGRDSPADALDQLLTALSGRRTKGRFYMIGREIRVSWGSEEDNGWDRPERMELEREELLRLVRDACSEKPPLQLDWYAVGPLD